MDLFIKRYWLYKKSITLFVMLPFYMRGGDIMQKSTVKKKNMLSKILSLTVIMMFVLPVFSLASTNLGYGYDTSVYPYSYTVSYTDGTYAYNFDVWSESPVYYNESTRKLVFTDDLISKQSTSQTYWSRSVDEIFPSDGFYIASPLDFSGQVLGNSGEQTPPVVTDPEVPNGDNEFFSSLTASNIGLSITSWVSNFNSLLLVVVSVGLGFVVVRFVRGLMF